MASWRFNQINRQDAMNAKMQSLLYCQHFVDQDVPLAQRL